MIDIQVRHTPETVRSITVSGHALFDDPGKDIVCAGVSAIVFGALNALDSMFESNVQLAVRTDRISIDVLHSDDELQACLCFLLMSLQTMEESYPEYIRISR